MIRAIQDALVSNYMHEDDLTGTRLEAYVDQLSRSPLEDDFRPWLKRYGLPEPLYNVQLGPYEVDVYYPGERLIVELDGWPFHRTKISFEADRERDAHMLARGIVTIRITRDRIEGAPAKEAERLREILNSRATLTSL